MGIQKFMKKTIRFAKTADDLRRVDPDDLAKVISFVPGRKMIPYTGLRLRIEGPLELSAQDWIQMAKNGMAMCRYEIDYRPRTPQPPDNAWTIKTVDGKLVGFAEVSHHTTNKAGNGWRLDMLCSARGQGLELLSRMLTFYRTQGAAFLELEPSSPEVGRSYKWVANKLGIEYTDSNCDGKVVETMFGRRVVLGGDDITFWLDVHSRWARRLIMSDGWRNIS